MRSIDHAIITVGDLDAAGTAWEALGFHVLPRMRHLVSGSANRIVQFTDSYVELLGDVDSLVSADYRRLYGGRLAIGEGLTNICFASTDLVADREAIVAAGVAAGPIASARRPVPMPDGRTEETDTDFFYPQYEGRPYAAPFFAQHHRPGTIFIPEYQRHPNTACGITGVIHYSPTPADDAAFFARIAVTDAEPVAGGARVRLEGGGTIDLLEAEPLRRMYGDALPALDPASGGYGVGLVIAVRSLSACRAALAVDVAGTAEGLLVPAAAVSGCFLLFRERG